MRSPRRKAPSVPASLQRSASASNRRFSLPENWRRLAIATTSGSRRAAASDAVSPVALRAPSATASEEEPNDPFIEDFSNEVMCMSYLYSKLPETGVSPHIGTGALQEPSRPGRANIWHLSMHTRACTAGLRPKQTCSNIFASAHLQSTKRCLRSNAQGSSADSAASLAVSKCSLIQNTCRSYDEPRSTSQNLCEEVLGQKLLDFTDRVESCRCCSDLSASPSLGIRHRDC